MKVDGNCGYRSIVALLGMGNMVACQNGFVERNLAMV